jgi:UDP-glucose 4-epimerase
VKGNFARLVHALQRGRFVPVGAGTNRRTLVYDEDAARAAVVAATTQPMTPGVYNVTDGEIHTVTEIVAAISSALGRSPRRFHLPASPVRGVLRLVDIVSRISRVKFPVSSATLDKYLEDVAVSGMKARLELGFEPRYSLEEGWRETIRHMAISPR